MVAEFIRLIGAGQLETILLCFLAKNKYKFIWKHLVFNLFQITSQGGIKNTEQTSLFALKHEDIVFLQKSGVTTTKDDHKYNYSTSSSGKYGRLNILNRKDVL